MAEIPTKDNMPALPRLTRVMESNEGVEDNCNTDEARLLWHARLTVGHDSGRFKQLFASHGFFVHLHDYNLPGKLPHL